MVDSEVSPLGNGSDDRLYFRQLLSGRDFAQGDMMARQMVNFVYLIGDRETGEAVAVDPAYAVQDLLDILAADGMELTGVLGTHFHPDHLGGQMGGWSLEGISTLLEKVQVPIHVQADEVPWVERTTGVGAADLVAHHSGDALQVGQVTIEMIHTPGHTPGHISVIAVDDDGRHVMLAGDATDTLEQLRSRRADAVAPDTQVHVRSLERILAHCAEHPTVFLPSHDPDSAARLAGAVLVAAA